MKIARLDNLARQDDLFIGNEPEIRYRRRQIIQVADNYDFAGNNATDVSTIPNWIKYEGRFNLLPGDTIDRCNGLISNWATHDQSDKDRLLDLVKTVSNPCVNELQMSDLEPMITHGFQVCNTDQSNRLEVWDGTIWKVINVT